MTTKAFKALTEKDLHTVGNVTSSHDYLQDIPHGAIMTEDVDNFTLVELGFNADGERTATPLSDKTKKGYLVASPERRYLGESLGEFYNGKGERGRILIQKEGIRFDASNFDAKAVKDIKAGQVAHFDIDTKEFVISDGTHADFETAGNKYTVVLSENDIQYTLGQPTVRFEVQ
ncbi:hypothetical protein [Lysinibacillus sp. NPDC086135]|uniref:hypothetical protein n=1 Tax=Lysinibacillus sp. NPDC086135 TaxID=3364130 RepID=UPI0038095814